MDVNLIVLIYLSIGVLINLYGPMAKAIRESPAKRKQMSRNAKKGLTSLLYALQRFMIQVFLRTMVLLFYPLLYVLYFIDNMRRRIPADSEPFGLEKDMLYFRKCSGVGVIRCRECDYNQEVVVLIHGGNMCDFKSGYQCQKCGKFHVIASGMRGKNEIVCECGGVLADDQPLLCPQCKSINIYYWMSYIT